jgi:CheY-like chemotaxis protein
MGKASEFGEDYSPRILVVHDDNLIRGLLYGLLESEGYEVLATASGAEALAILGQARRPIDLLVTDFRIPEMSGERLALECLSSGRGVRVLYVSAACDCEEAELEKDLLKLKFPVAPRRAVELLKKVKELLLVKLPAETPGRFITLAAGSHVM